MKTLKLNYKGRDSWDRPVYECDGKLYVDVDPRKHMPARICTKSDNEFDGEPEWDIDKDIEIVFIPIRNLNTTNNPVKASN